MNARSVRSDQWVVEVLRHGDPVWVAHRGLSMFPALCAGDRLRIDPLRPAKPGGIALFETAHGLVAHRIISVGPLITQGDAVANADPPHQEGQLLGVVADIERCSSFRFFRELARCLLCSFHRPRGA